MRKIITKDERHKINRRNQLIIGGVMIGLMLLSTLGYAISVKEGNNKNDVKKLEYKGIIFLKESEYWLFQYSGANFITKYNPKETENISSFGYLFLEKYKDKPLYIAGDRAEAYMEINTNLMQLVQRIQPSCNEKNCSENLPVKNCSIDNIIIFIVPNNSSDSIKIQEKCIIITADYPERIRYADNVIYKILGI
jgi:hypothetical protein